NPIRPEIAAVRRAPTSPPVVAVVGGSLGARRINDATLGVYDLWRARGDVVIHHVTGTRDYEGCRIRLDALRAPPTGWSTGWCDTRTTWPTCTAPPPSWSPDPGACPPSSPRSGCPRCSYPSRARPATTRRRTRGCSPARARRCSYPTATST